MKTYLKVMTVAVVGLSIVAGGGYAAWFAWDKGLIGKNPRAPVAAAMEQAVRKQAMVNINSMGAVPCINLDLSRPAPEVSGIAGIALSPVPGRYLVTLLRQINMRDQPLRDLQLGQMDFLTAQGFFTATDSTVDTNGGKRPARTYQLTWDGYTNARQNYGRSLCLEYGRREFAGINKIEKLPEKVMDHEVYDVTYLSKQADMPAWVNSPDAKRWFPKLQELTADSENHAKVIRTKEGWRSAFEIEMEASLAAKGQVTGYDYQRDMMNNLVRQPPTPDEVKQLIVEQSADPNWVSRSGIACLPLQLQRGGDVKPAPLDYRNPDRSTPFTVTYYDRGDRREYDYRTMFKTLHELSALEHAGLAKMVRIKPVHSKRKTGRNSMTSAPDEQNGGIQYVLTREAAEALGISNFGGGCIPAGRISIDLLSVQGNRGSVQIRARGIVDQTPELAVKIGEELPALRSLIENGVQMSGQMSFATIQGEGKWRLGSLQPGYPEMNYDSLPAHLVPLMPLTAAALTAKPVNAPSLMGQSADLFGQANEARSARVPPVMVQEAAPQAMESTAPMNAPAPAAIAVPSTP